MRILFAGDIVGNKAAKAVANWAKVLRAENKVDFFLANGENAAEGNGITVSQSNMLLQSGVDCISLGNHCWGHWGLSKHIDKEARIIRPGNVPRSWPGKSSVILQHANLKLRVINLIGQTFMQAHANPFSFMDEYLNTIDDAIPTLVDFHAEASAEKVAMGSFLAGRVSAVIGTHTHVQTADERILEDQTAYITDVGMCGPINGVIGMDTNQSLRRFVDNLPASYMTAEGPLAFRAVYMEIDSNGRAQKIARVHMEEMYENEWQDLPPATLPLVK